GCHPRQPETGVCVRLPDLTTCANVFASTATAPEETRTLALDRHAPEWLQDATKFKTHAHIFNPVWVIRTLRRYEGPPHRLLDPLYQAVEEAAKDAGSGFG